MSPLHTHPNVVLSVIDRDSHTSLKVNETEGQIQPLLVVVGKTNVGFILLLPMPYYNMELFSIIGTICISATCIIIATGLVAVPIGLWCHNRKENTTPG